MNILIIDDTNSKAMSIVNALNEDDTYVIKTNYIDGIIAIKETKYDIIFVDRYLPRSLGSDDINDYSSYILREINRSDKNKNSISILYSSELAKNNTKYKYQIEYDYSVYMIPIIKEYLDEIKSYCTEDK